MVRNTANARNAARAAESSTATTVARGRTAGTVCKSINPTTTICDGESNE